MVPITIFLSYSWAASLGPLCPWERLNFGVDTSKWGVVGTFWKLPTVRSRDTISGNKQQVSRPAQTLTISGQIIQLCGFGLPDCVMLVVTAGWADQRLLGAEVTVNL